MMTDRLRELFDDMLADEPPLRTDPDEAEAAGRRLRNRYRTLWTVAGAALTATLVAAGPSMLTLGYQAAPYGPGAASADILVSEAASSPAFAISPPVTTPSAETLAATLHCPADIAPYTVDNRDGSVLPDPGRAAQAVVAAAVKIAPGEKFLVNTSGRIETSEKSPGVPQVYLVFDVGTDRGYGSVNLQLIADKTGTPQERAENALDRTGECVDVQRRDYPDGSVAVYYPYGPPAQEAEVTHVWYFARAGYNMNIGVFPQAWSSSSDPNTAPPPSALPPLGYLPLSISQVMDLANVVADSG
jgi:hypothetical protein